MTETNANPAKADPHEDTDYDGDAEERLAEVVANARQLDWDLFEARQAIVRTLAVTGHPEIDGCDHPHTGALHDRLNATGFALSPWWAQTPTDWVCPGCGRDKDAIARRDKNGRLMGKLFEHHDHMDAILQRTFQQVAAQQPHVVADTDAETFAKRLAPGIAAFDPVVICQDCNNADTKAKKLAGADRDFSFPVQDIATFVRPQPNAPHEVDPEATRAAWAAAKPAHDTRMQVVVRLAEIAATRDHWYRPAPPGAAVVEQERDARHRILTPTALPRLTDLPSELWTDGPRPAQPANAWRRAPRPRTRIPHDGEIDTCARVSHTGYWQAVDDTWHCPVCERAKRAVVRESRRRESSNPFTFMVWTVTFADTGRVTVCDACWKDKLALEKEAGVEHGRLTMAAFRQAIRPADHQRHGLDTTAIAELVARLQRGENP